VQDRAANESAEHHDTTHFSRECFCLVNEQVTSNRNNQHDLASKAQHHMDENIHSFFLPDQNVSLLIFNFVLFV
jgi:hypothetical protein